MQTSIRPPCLRRCFLLMAFFALLTPNMAATVKNKSVDKKNVCLTAECKSTASTVLSFMKPELDPCNNFYEYVCGGFLERSIIPNDQSLVDTLTPMNKHVQKAVESILLQERPATDPKHLQLPNKLYEGCMNTALLEKLGASPMQEIDDSLGGWPVVKGNTWNANNKWTWVKAIKDFRRLGFSVNRIIWFGVGPDFKDSTKNILSVDDPETLVDREYLIKGIDDPVVSAYYKYMVDTAVLFGAKRDVAEKEMLESIQFEITLSKMSLSAEDRTNVSILDTTLTIKEVQKRWPYINWLEYINALLPTGLTVNETEPMNVASIKYLDNLGPLLAKTPKRTVANYLMWTIHHFANGFLSKKFQDRNDQFYSEHESKKIECINTLPLCFTPILGSLYVQKYVPKETKNAVSSILMDIRQAFNNILTNEEWLDPATRSVAIKKLKAMEATVAYPDELLDNNKLAEYYLELEIDPEKYFLAYLNTTKFMTDKSIGQLRLPVKRLDWTNFDPTEVNAYYVQNKNTIKLPAGFLQGHMFNAKRPNYMNFGAIGWVIGHEVTHGFDQVGSQSDLNGNLKNWWPKSTREAFLKRAECIVEQYGNHTDRRTGLKLNGINTEAENIADNGGIREAYFAYKNWVKNNGAEAQLPGLDFTAEQMFWISAGQTWCINATLAYTKDAINTDSHSTGEFRIIGSFSNQKEFATDFKCPLRSPMNPVKKCQVW